MDIKGLPVAVPCASEHKCGSFGPSRYCASISGARTLLQEQWKNRPNSRPLRTPGHGMCDTAQPEIRLAAIVARSMRASNQRTLAEYAMTRVRQSRCGTHFFDRAGAGRTTGV